jgi:hypothetical protein
MTHPLCPSDISPKYDMESFYNQPNLGGRIWGRKSADPPAGMSALEGEIEALVYKLYGLIKDEVKIVEGKRAPPPPADAGTNH